MIQVWHGEIPEIVRGQPEIEIKRCCCNVCIRDIDGLSLALPHILQVTGLARYALSNFDAFKAINKRLCRSGFRGPHPRIDLCHTNDRTGECVTCMLPLVQKLAPTTPDAKGIDDYRGVKKYGHSFARFRVCLSRPISASLRSFLTHAAAPPAASMSGWSSGFHAGVSFSRKAERRRRFSAWRTTSASRARMTSSPIGGWSFSAPVMFCTSSGNGRTLRVTLTVRTSVFIAVYLPSCSTTNNILANESGSDPSISYLNSSMQFPGSLKRLETRAQIDCTGPRCENESRQLPGISWPEDCRTLNETVHAPSATIL